MTSIGKRCSADGMDSTMKNHRGRWCQVVIIRISNSTETLAEKRAALDEVAEVSALTLLIYLLNVIVKVIEHA
jgi:hypothetical protein